MKMIHCKSLPAIASSDQKKTTQICRYLLIKKTMNTEKTFCINQQLIQLDFIADFYLLKCYETFAHTI